MNMAMKIPVVVLSGFLGSGKTTLLVKLLEEAAARGLKPGVLMNELGKRDIDGELVARSSSIRFRWKTAGRLYLLHQKGRNPGGPGRPASSGTRPAAAGAHRGGEP